MLPIDRHVIRSSLILLIAIIALSAAGFVLQTVRLSNEAVLWDDIATRVELNRVELKRLQNELDQLQQQLSSATTSFRINYEYLRMRHTPENTRMGEAYAPQKRMTSQEIAFSQKLECLSNNTSLNGSES